MSNTIPFVLKLQADAINQDISVSSLLRTAKVIATKLDLDDALVWIDRELKGYEGVTPEELPAYRRLSGEPKALNPYHGWQPMYFEDAETQKLISQAPIFQALGSLEETFQNNDSDHMVYPYLPEHRALLKGVMEFHTDVHVRLSKSLIFNILDSVRNLILNWSLQLEKAGILGDGMKFSQDDKKDAAPITQQFFAQNIGVVGNIGEQAEVTTEQAATINVALDLAEVRDFVSQVRTALPLLSDDVREGLEPTVSELEGELASDAPNQSKLRKLLGSAREVCEGAAGNIAAQGILGILKSLLSG